MNRDDESLTDGELARRAQAGSLEAFEELVCRYENRIYAFVAQHFRNHMDAREVTQDTFVRAFQAIQQFDPGREFGPWLFTIARRKCIDRYRAAPPECELPAPEAADNNTPHEALAAEDERAALWKVARACLPGLQYEALWLRYAEEMDVAQVARVLRKTTVHIKVLLFRARQTLGAHLNNLTGVPADRPPSSHLRAMVHQGAPVTPTAFLPLRNQKESI